MLHRACRELLWIAQRLTAHKKLPTAKPLTGFLLEPVDVRDKRAPYATLLSGIQFALHSTLEIEAQCKEARRALLRTLPVSDDLTEFGQAGLSTK